MPRLMLTTTLLIAVSTAVAAQETTGTITGVTTDQSGAVVSDRHNPEHRAARDVPSA
jgi:hypothetical protein